MGLSRPCVGSSCRLHVGSWFWSFSIRLPAYVLQLVVFRLGRDSEKICGFDKQGDDLAQRKQKSWDRRIAADEIHGLL